MTNHTQRGLKAAATYDTVDNLAMSYIGNQLTNVHNVGTGSNASVTHAHFQDYSKDAVKTKVEYAYNANGAMTQDLNKGISTIQYNSLNLPRQMDIKSPVAEARNEYTYSASGQKLRVVSKWNSTYNKAPILGSAINGSLLNMSKTTDYVGNKIYENGVLKRILIDGGYIEGNKYHYYQTDHLGNNRVVADASGTIVQSTHYYPFGMVFPEGAGQEKQPYKYNGKELDNMHGLNTYDYSARYMAPDIGRFTSVDPLAEKYYSISPYAYVMNNPMKFIDPDGRQVRIPFNPGQMRASAYNQVGQEAQIPTATSYKLRVTTPIFSTTLVGVTTAHKGKDKGTSRMLSDGGGAFGTDLSISLEVEHTYSSDSDNFELNDLKGESKGGNLGLGYINMGKSTATVEKDGQKSELNSTSIGIGLSPPIGRLLKV